MGTDTSNSPSSYLVGALQVHLTHGYESLSYIILVFEAKSELLFQRKHVHTCLLWNNAYIYASKHDHNIVIITVRENAMK